MSTSAKSIYNPKVAWLALLGGLGIYFVNGACQMAVPPVMSDLCIALDMSLADAGWLMSVMSLVALVMAIPTGYIIMKLGVKWATVLTAAFNLVGALIGVFATNFAMMMVCRVFEGVALGLVSVVAFQVVTVFFPPEKRGIPNSLVTASFVVSYFMIMNVATPITETFALTGFWWFCVLMSAVSVALAFLIPGKANEPNFEPEPEAGARKERGGQKKVWMNPFLWFLAISFIVYNIGYGGITTYMPTYLVDDVQASQGVANFAVSWNSLAGGFGAVFGGFLLNRFAPANRKWIPAVTMILLAVCYFFAFQLPTVETAAAVLIAVGFMSAIVPPALYTIGPDIIPNPMYTPLVLAIITLGGNTGMTLGPIVTGYIYEAFGNWSSVSIPIAVCSLVGAVLCLMVKVKKTANAKKDEAVSVAE